MQPKPNDLIACYYTGELSPFKDFNRFAGPVNDYLGNDEFVLRHYWNKIRPDGTYNNLILKDENGDDVKRSQLRYQIWALTKDMSREHLILWLKSQDLNNP